jgi:hypothetical protein
LASAEGEPTVSAGSAVSIIAAIIGNLMLAFLMFYVAKSASDLGSASPLGKVQRKHFTWSSPRSRGNHCNSAYARLYNAFPLKFDPLRLRLRVEPASARKRSRSYRS